MCCISISMISSNMIMSQCYTSYVVRFLAGGHVNFQEYTAESIRLDWELAK